MLTQQQQLQRSSGRTAPRSLHQQKASPSRRVRVRSSAEELVRPTTPGSSPDAVSVRTLVSCCVHASKATRVCLGLNAHTPLPAVLQFAPLKQGIAKFYNESSGLWESVWGEHMHHGERAEHCAPSLGLGEPCWHAPVAVQCALLWTSTTNAHQSSTGSFCLAGTVWLQAITQQAPPPKAMRRHR